MIPTRVGHTPCWLQTPAKPVQIPFSHIRSQFGIHSNGRQVNFFFLILILFIYLFLAALGLRCCARAFSSCSEWELLFLAVCELLNVVASPVAEHGLQAHGLQQLQHPGSIVEACGLQSAGSVVVAHGLSCSTARGIFPDQGSNPRPLHWQADSQPLRHQGSLINRFWKLN